MRVAPVPAVTSMYTHVTNAAIHCNCQRQPASATRQLAGRQRGLASAALAGTGSDWQLVRRCVRNEFYGALLTFCTGMMVGVVLAQFWGP